MRRGTVVLALVVLFAGCAGLGSSDEAATVTPAPVPTDEFRYPPGVTSDRVVPGTLTSAHVRSLATTNYTLTTRQTVRAYDGDPVLRVNQTRTVARDASAYDGRIEIKTRLFVDREVSEIEFWSDSSTIVTRYSTDNPYREPEVRQWSVGSGGSITDLTDSHHLDGTLAGSEVTSIRRTPAGGVVLAGSGIRDPERLVVPLIVSEPRNLSLQARVRSDGVVLAIHVTYDATHDGERVHVQRWMRVTDIGTATVDRPRWAENGTSADGYTTYG